MDKPSPPPEAILLRLVRTAAGIKASDAAADVARHSMRSFSAARWSQIENGYETRGGSYKRVTASDATLAHMARAVGISPERLEFEGERPDAARILREMQQQRGAQAAPDPLEQARPEGTPGTWISPENIARADQVYMPAIRERLAALAAQGIEDPAGSELFPDDPGLAGAYDGDRLRGSDVYSAAWMAALVAEQNDRLGSRGRGPRHGSAGA